MNDELLTLTDTRGRAAGTAVQRAAIVHAWNAPAPKQPTVWLRPALVMAAVVAVIAGLVWVSGRQADPADQRDPADLRYVIGDLPEGWRPSRAEEADARQRPSELANLRVALFGTSGAPTAPTLQLYWQDPSKDLSVTVGGAMGLAQGENLREIEVGSTGAACAELGATRCVMDAAFGQVNSTSKGLDDADLAQLLSEVQIVGGEITIDAGSLPDGMVLLFQGSWDDQQFLMWAPMKGPGASRVEYTDISRERGVLLTTGWQADSDLAGASLIWEDLQQVTVNGRPAFTGFSQLMESSVLFWTDGTRAFALVSSDTSVDLVAMAELVRPAVGDEWSAIVVEDQGVGSDVTSLAEGTYAATPETTVLGEAPAGTDPPVTLPVASEVQDVVVTQTVQQISEVDASYSCELPSGSYGSVQIAVIAGTVLARDSSGTSGSFWWQIDGPVFTEASTYSVNGSDGVVAVSTDPAAAQLRVTRANGDRYLLDLVAVDGHPEVKVGVIVLPPASFVTYDVIDAEGNVLTSYESP